MRALHWLSAIGLIVGATLAVRAERLPVKTYTTTDGLAHNSVERIVRDSRGFLWFCTFEGLSRFDGYAFKTYGIDQGLPSPVVHDLLETRTGEYWVATGVDSAASIPGELPSHKPQRARSNQPPQMQCSRSTFRARMRIREMLPSSSKIETALSGAGLPGGFIGWKSRTERQCSDLSNWGYALT